MRARLLALDSNENGDSKDDFEEYRPTTPEPSQNGILYTLNCTYQFGLVLVFLLDFFSLICLLVLGSNLVKEPSWTALPEEDSGSEEGYLSPRSSPNLDCRSSIPPHTKITHRALLSGAALLASVALGRHLEPQHPPTPPPRTAYRTNVPALELVREQPLLAVMDLPTDPTLVADLITFSTDSLPQELLVDSLKPTENKQLPLTPPPPNPRERDRTSQKTVQHSFAEWIANGETESVNQTGDRRRRSSHGLSSQLGKLRFLRCYYYLNLSSIKIFYVFSSFPQCWIYHYVKILWKQMRNSRSHLLSTPILVFGALKRGAWR